MTSDPVSKTTGRVPVAILLEYISRAPVSVSNVASHFGLTTEQAQAELARMEDWGAVRKVAGAIPMWECENAR